MITKQSNNLFATNKHSNAKHLNAHSHSLQPCNANTNLLKMSKRYTFYLLVFCSSTAHQSWNPFVMTILTISIITIITTDTMRSRKQWSHELKTKSRDLATHAHIAHSLIMIDRTYIINMYFIWLRQRLTFVLFCPHPRHIIHWHLFSCDCHAA